MQTEEAVVRIRFCFIQFSVYTFCQLKKLNILTKNGQCDAFCQLFPCKAALIKVNCSHDKWGDCPLAACHYLGHWLDICSNFIQLACISIENPSKYDAYQRVEYLKLILVLKFNSYFWFDKRQNIFLICELEVSLEADLLSQHS